VLLKLLSEKVGVSFIDGAGLSVTVRVLLNCGAAAASSLVVFSLIAVSGTLLFCLSGLSVDVKILLILGALSGLLIEPSPD
jgi:hypothetical protein